MAPPSVNVANNGSGYVNSSEDFEKWIRMATDNVSIF